MAEELELTETTRDEVGGVGVGVGNILDDDEYELPGGATGLGLTARLHVEGGERLVVGRGSVFELGDGRWEVLDVVDGGDDFGTVTLRRVG
jgi:Family of unknown function (DUF6406)